MKRSDISDYEVCLAVEDFQKTMGNFPYEVLARKFNCDEKLAYSACKRAEENGLIEYGVSLRTGWLTEKGKQVLVPPTTTNDRE